MCRKKDRGGGGCELLDANTSKWNRSALLPRNAAVDAGFQHFDRAIRFAADGRPADARIELGRLDECALRDWYVRHAQVAGIRRVEILRNKGEEWASGHR